MNTRIARTIKSLLSVLLVLTTITFSSAINAAANDPRFFGTYCGVRPVNVELPGRDDSFDLDIKLYAKHAEPRPGKGVVMGKGVAIARNVGEKLRDRGLAEGRRFPFVFAGVVQSRGVLSGSTRVAGREPSSGMVTLDEDGEVITMEALDLGEILLSKEACGNDEPTAQIINPAADNATYPWGKLNSLHGSASDSEDEVSDMQMTWTSSRDPEWRQEGKGRASAHIEELSPGTHKITFTVTDSGGRSASAKRQIVIANTRPNEPIIHVPATNAHFTAGQCVPFSGSASDEQEGDLTADSLVWTSNLVARPLGTGGNFVCRPPECVLPQGAHTITLTATDNAGASRSTSTPITIDPRTAGNSAPSVWIENPPNWHVMSVQPVSGDDPERNTLKAGFCDLEDETLADDRFEWMIERLEIEGGAIVGQTSIAVENGKTAVFDPRQHEIDTGHEYKVDTRHEVKVKVRDMNNESRVSEPIYIIVLPGIGLY